MANELHRQGTRAWRCIKQFPALHRGTSTVDKRESSKCVQCLSLFLIDIYDLDLIAKVHICCTHTIANNENDVGRSCDGTRRKPSQGITWTEPVNITDAIGVVSVGPPGGVQLVRSELVVTLY